MDYIQEMGTIMPAVVIEPGRSIVAEAGISLYTIGSKAATPGTDKVTICGKCCETGDVLIKDLTIAEGVEAGDILAVFSTGGYSYSMACNYNNSPKPAVILTKEGRSDLIVRRQTYDDIISNNVIPESLR